jgi:hypothetical protein
MVLLDDARQDGVSLPRGSSSTNGRHYMSALLRPPNPTTLAAYKYSAIFRARNRREMLAFSKHTIVASTRRRRCTIIHMSRYSGRGHSSNIHKLMPVRRRGYERRGARTGWIRRALTSPRVFIVIYACQTVTNRVWCRVLLG